MPDRLNVIMTRTGDDGHTSLQGKRLPKDDLLVEAVGQLDELNAAIGVILASHCQEEDVVNCLSQVQNDLFDFGGELHAPKHPKIDDTKIALLEKMILNWNENLPPLKEFILPRGNLAATTCHLARTICRRAERSLIRLHRQTPLSNTALLRYLNRLSDVLFIAARMINRQAGIAETMWQR